MLPHSFAALTVIGLQKENVKCLSVAIVRESKNCKILWPPEVDIREP